MTIPTGATGYSSAEYIRSLGQEPVPLGQTGGFVVARPIEQGHDLASGYPVFSCQDWTALEEAVAGLARGPITLTLVADPFNDLGEARLAPVFPVCRKLHDHWVVDLHAPPAVSRHHRYMLRRTGPVRIEAGPAGPEMGPIWAPLYANMVRRKGVRDSRAFSEESLIAQLAVPGAHLITAWDGEILLGSDLYYLDRRRAFAHLSGYTDAGYDRSISYAMQAASFDYLRPIADVLDLGGAPAGPAGKGIADFKSGWTALTLPSFLCGKVLDPAAYAALAPGADPDGYFPAYRAGEFRR